MKIPGKVYLILSVVIIAFSNSIIKKLVIIGGSASGPCGHNPITFCNVLFVGNLCALLTLTFVFRKSWDLTLFKKLALKDWSALCVISILSVVIAPISIFIALQHTTVANVVLVGRIGPALMLALSIFLLKEPTNYLQIIGSIIAFCGVVLMIFLQQDASQNQNFALGKGEILTAIAAISFCFATIFSKQVLKNISLGVFAVFRLVVGTVVFFIIAVYLFGVHHFAEAFSPLLWKWMVLYGVIVVAMGQLFWFKGLNLAKASEASLISSFSPVIGIIAAFLILAEIPTFAQYVGGVIIFWGIFLGQFGNFYKPKKEKDPETRVKENMDGEVGFKGI